MHAFTPCPFVKENKDNISNACETAKMRRSFRSVRKHSHAPIWHSGKLGNVIKQASLPIYTLLSYWLRL